MARTVCAGNCTSNYALFDAGKVSGTACLNVGGRLLETDAQTSFALRRRDRQ
ncbi:ethanolamine ammonia-lyase reactivating factor EutA [Salmonella enterica]|uniref:ethanolamine ammonia-lyase reactivating factor EutA n=1 Tax=Salmonella enterica TaxID=28901 RepID=UPI003523887A